MKSSPITLALTCVLTFCLGPQVHAADAGMITPADRTFVHKVGLGGMFEVDASRLAQKKGQSKDVRDFSANEIKDHVKVNSELAKIASAEGLEVPAHRDVTFQKRLDDLGRQSGEAFDRAYLQSMAKIHDGDEALFLEEARGTQDARLKAFAAKTAKIVKGHIDMLHAIEAKGMK